MFAHFKAQENTEINLSWMFLTILRAIVDGVNIIKQNI